MGKHYILEVRDAEGHLKFDKDGYDSYKKLSTFPFDVLYCTLDDLGRQYFRENPNSNGIPALELFTWLKEYGISAREVTWR